MKTFKQFLKEQEDHPMIDVDGESKHRNNSEGRPIHHTDEGIRNFHRWFKDSKATDEQGRPKVLYHGTSSNFSEFDPDKGEPTIRALGFHFTSDKDRAKRFGSGEGGNVMPVYLRTTNPHTLLKGEHNEFPKKYGKYGTDKMHSDFKSRGNTGFKIDNDHHIVFEPNQIKSATGNSGKFAADSNDITENYLYW
jgi:hypothetical protein